MGIAAYVKTVWVSGAVPAIDKDTLDNIEDQLAAITAELVKLTTAGDLPYATAAGTLNRLALGAAPGARLGPNAAGTAPEWVGAPDSDDVAAVESTTSTSYTDLATAGPEVTIVTGTKALVLINARFDLSTGGNNFCSMSVEVSGATTIAASQAWDLGRLNNDWIRAGRSIVFGAGTIPGALIAGSNTFTMKYASPSAGTGVYANRELIVIPL